MPKRAFPIHPFRGGIRGGVGADDYPPGVAATGIGFEPDAPQGVLRSTGLDTALTGVPTQTDDAVPFVVAVLDGVLALVTATDMRVVTRTGATTFSSANHDRDLTEAGSYTVGVPVRAAAFAGGARLGTANGPALFVHPDVETAPLLTFAGLYPLQGVTAGPTPDGFEALAKALGLQQPSWGADDANGPFKTTTAYEWWASVVYDGVQESPPIILNSWQAGGDWLGTRVTPTTQNKTFASLPLILLGNSDHNPGYWKRATAINVYRKEIIGGLYSDLRLVESVDLTKFSAPDGSGHRYYTVTDDGDEGPTFAENAGYDPTVSQLVTDYGLSAAVDAYHVVAQIRGLDVEAATVVVSEPYQPDVLDWTKRWVRLPETPVAMVGWRDVAFCFTSRSCYLVDPEFVALRDELEGFTAIGPNAVATCPYGVFAIGADGRARFYNGSEVLDVGEIAGPWLTDALAAEADPYVAWDANAFLFRIWTGQVNASSGGAEDAVVTFEPRGAMGPTWGLTRVSAPVTAMVRGLDGQAWAFTDTGLVKGVVSLGTGAYDMFQWTSRRLDLGSPGTKRIYQVHLGTEPILPHEDIDVEISVDGGAFVLLDNTAIAGLYDLPTIQQGRSAVVRITSQEDAVVIDTCEVILRDMRSASTV